MALSEEPLKMIRFLILFFTPILFAGQMRWTMVNVNHTDKQGDAHLLEFPDGSVRMIDVGFDGNWVLPFLKEKKITALDQVIISHAHQDHYQGLYRLIEKGISIKEVVFNFPPKSICDSEIPWGCDFNDLKKLKLLLEEKKIPVKTSFPNEILYQQRNLTLKTLFAYDGVNTPVGTTDINDMSLIIKLSAWQTTVLFTGDLNRAIGEFLAKNASSAELKADILKVPHHGGESLAPDTFLEKVNPLVALIPAPKSLWNDKRCDRVKHFFNITGVPVFVNGISGHIYVDFNEKGFLVSSEK